MALPKWLSKLIRIIEILLERNANQGRIIADLQARQEAIELAMGANSEADSVLAKRLEVLQSESTAQDEEAIALLDKFKQDSDESLEPKV